MNGVELIAAERQRQIEQEGWSPEHDDEHTCGEIARAAAAYTLTTIPATSAIGTVVWPWDHVYFKPKDHLRDLVRAGALIAAEIDRLQRQAGGA